MDKAVLVPRIHDLSLRKGESFNGGIEFTDTAGDSRKLVRCWKKTSSVVNSQYAGMRLARGSAS